MARRLEGGLNTLGSGDVARVRRHSRRRRPSPIQRPKASKISRFTLNKIATKYYLTYYCVKFSSKRLLDEVISRCWPSVRGAYCWCWLCGDRIRLLGCNGWGETIYIH